MKSLHLVFSTLALLGTLSAQAALKPADVRKAVSGQYTFESTQGAVRLAVRSSGAVQVISTAESIQSARLISVNHASDIGPDALPVVVLSVLVGSDEDSNAYQFVLTAEQHDGLVSPRLISAYSTLNDGPNMWTSAETGRLKLKKYNTNQGRFVELR
jgi:hypothetical protein